MTARAIDCAGQVQNLGVGCPNLGNDTPGYGVLSCGDPAAVLEAA